MSWMWCNSWRYGHGKWPKLKQKKVFDAIKDTLPNTVTKSIAVSGSLNRCRWYIIPAVYTTYIPLIFANWVIICYLPPIKGTRKLYWLNVTSPSVVPILFRVCFVFAFYVLSSQKSREDTRVHRRQVTKCCSRFLTWATKKTLLL